MNWQVTTPGTIVFEKEEPFCFLFPIRKQAVLDWCVAQLRSNDLGRKGALPMPH
jgi:hypothetical protein